MEDFLEANRIVEISVSKLTSIKRNGNLPLRKTLLVSHTFNMAQDKATSAQASLLSHPQERCSSKLLASFGHNHEDSAASPLRTVKSLRQQSSIVTECHELPPLPQEPMDFENVNTILGDILQDCDGDHENQRPPTQRKVLEDLSNTSKSRWLMDNPLSSELAPNRPISPGKRNYEQAFPFLADYLTNIDPCVDFKRFKFETSPLESLPGCYGYLSSKNLQTAPFITYMFGRGFTHPSNPDSAVNNWPTARSDYLDQNLIVPPNNSIVSPILAF